MFNKKDCSKCGKKINSSYDFCPFCGNYLSDKKISKNQDYGLLGKNDNENELNLPMGFNALFNTLIKSLDKQFKNLENSNSKEEKNPSKKTNFSINISSKEGMPPQIKIKSFGSPEKKVEDFEKKDMPSKQFSSKKLKEFSKLQKKEPKTEMRRLADSLVYELSVPGVESIDDISVTKFENSIEIKAVGKKQGYSKQIPVGLPIKDYKLDEGKFILELDSNSNE